jgi:hypothetical protein
MDSFVHAGLSAKSLGQLRRHACEVHHRYCQRAEPETTLEESLELMFSYLPPPRRARWQAALA